MESDKSYPLDLPFELVVDVIGKMEYNDVMSLCQTSKEFAELCSNDVVKGILKEKRKKKIVAKLWFYESGEGAMDLYMIDPIKGNKNIIRVFFEEIKKSDVSELNKKLSKNVFLEDFDVIDNFTVIIYDPDDENGQVYIRSGDVNFDINKDIFTKLMKEFETIDETEGTIVVYTNLHSRYEPLD